MDRFMRNATVKTIADIPAALQLAGEVTAYINKNYSLNMKFGIEMYGGFTIQWHF